MPPLAGEARQFAEFESRHVELPPVAQPPSPPPRRRRRSRNRCRPWDGGTRPARRRTRTCAEGTAIRSTRGSRRSKRRTPRRIRVGRGRRRLRMSTHRGRSRGSRSRRLWGDVGRATRRGWRRRTSGGSTSAFLRGTRTWQVVGGGGGGPMRSSQSTGGMTNNGPSW